MGHGSRYGLRYGFKAEARRLALDARSELGIAALDVLDPYALAELYGVRVAGLDEVDCSAAARAHFTVVNPAVFSAALIPDGTAVLVVENPAHPFERRRSTMAHEMGHVLLEHRFGAVLVNEFGCRASGGAQEAEAAELGGELLVPFEAARALAGRGATDEHVAARFRVSVAFARWRMNATGAREIARRAARQAGAPRTAS